MKYFNEEVIYIHPYTPFLYPCINIPYSLPALINRLPFKIKGYFAEDLNRSTIKKARIFVIDVHWFISLYGAYILCKRIKSLNKEAIIVAGGITATEYPFMLIEKFGIDYVIRGDAEIPFPKLIDFLLNNKDLNTVPNLVGKNDFSTKWEYVLTQKDLDENNYLDIDFFPAYKEFAYKIHNSGDDRIIPSPMHPYIMVSRGCPYRCKHCAGGAEEQQRIFNRKNLVRSARRIKEDLVAANADKNLKYVQFQQDLLNLCIDSDLELILDDKYNLILGHDLFFIPKRKNLELLLKAFPLKGTISFSLGEIHVQTDHVNDIDPMIESIELVQSYGFFPVVYYSEQFRHTNPKYEQAYQQLKRIGRISFSEVGYWFVHYPRPNEMGLSNNDHFGFFLYHSYMQEKKFNKTRHMGERSFLETCKLKYYLARNYNSINHLIKSLGLEYKVPEI